MSNPTSFQAGDKTVTLNITIGLARKLKEEGTLDLLQSENYPTALLSLANPLNRFDILYHLIPEGTFESQAVFEAVLEEPQPAMRALDAAITNFIQAIGEDCLELWQSSLKNVKKISDKQMEAMDQIIADPKVKEHIDQAIETTLKKILSTSPELTK